MKDWLGWENARNKQHAAIYTEIMRRAFGGTGSVQVLIGHHLTFEQNGDLDTENEIPSADCLLFDHEIMGKVFGENAIPLMQALASVPCVAREPIVKAALASLPV